MKTPTHKTKITRTQLDGLAKGKLVNIIREMEGYLVDVANANEEMSWRGPSDHQQMCYTRWLSMRDAMTQLQKLAKGNNL